LERCQALSAGERQAASRRERDELAICQIDLESPDLTGEGLDHVKEAGAAFLRRRQIVWSVGERGIRREQRDTAIRPHRVTRDATDTRWDATPHVIANVCVIARY